MLALRIIATVILGISCITSALKNISIFGGTPREFTYITYTTLYSWLWRAFIIVVVWVI